MGILNKAQYEEAKRMQNGIPLYIPRAAISTIDHLSGSLQILANGVYAVGNIRTDPEAHAKIAAACDVVFELEAEGWIIRPKESVHENCQSDSSTTR